MGTAAREKLLDRVLPDDEPHRIELAREMDVLRQITCDLSIPRATEAGSKRSNTSEIATALAILRRLTRDVRFENARPVFEIVTAHVNAGEWEQADTLVLGVFNRAWESSQEYHVARDAFFRRVRGREFKTLSHANPMTSDRAAALAQIMQTGKEDLEALFQAPEDHPKELVINLEGDFGTIRLVKV